MAKTPYGLYVDGLRQYNKQDYTKAVELLTQSGELGDINAQCLLGKIYQEGQGVEQDFEKAAEWYQRSAEQGNERAQNSLGELYEKRLNNCDKAVELYQKAAKQGYLKAQNNLGAIYENQLGDYTKAIEWYKKAVEKGDETAQKKMDDCFEKYLQTGRLKCQRCEKELNESSTKARITKHSIICIDCYKNFLTDNNAETTTLKSKIKKQFILIAIGVLIGFAVGMTLFFTVGSKVPGYVPFRWPVLIYLTLGFAPLLLFLAMVWRSFTKRNKISRSRSGDFSIVYFGIIIVLFVVILAGSFIYAPFHTIYRIILNFVNLTRLKEIKELNESMITQIDNHAEKYVPGIDECTEKNSLLTKIGKKYK